MLFVPTIVAKRLFSQRNPLLYSADNVFNEENVKKTATKFSRMKPVRRYTHLPAKKAAVLIPLCQVDGKVSLLYTLRAKQLKNHRGQVSFPGGMQDDDDKTLENTALRETFEELGISPEGVDIWASGQLIVTKYETCVLPVIGRVVDEIKIRELNVNTSEVEEVFSVPLEDLCNPKTLKYTQFKSGATLPVFLGGKRRIWGLTALITNMCLLSLLPPEAYTHKIKYIPPVKNISLYNFSHT